MKERPQSSKLFDLVAAVFDAGGNQVSSAIKSDGKEYPDGVPLAPPIGYEPPTQLESLIEQIIRRRDFNAAVEAAGDETFEEADDFDVEDEDYDPRFQESIYEKYFEAKSKRAAQRAAQTASSGQTSSSDLDAAPLKAKTVETPKSDDQPVSRSDIVGNTSVGSKGQARPE